MSAKWNLNSSSDLIEKTRNSDAGIDKLRDENVVLQNYIDNLTWVECSLRSLAYLLQSAIAARRQQLKINFFFLYYHMLDPSVYLQRQGWQVGQGLKENSISRPIPAPRKRNLNGIGRDRDDGHLFHSR